MRPINSVSEAAHRARAEGAIGERRSAQIARHVKHAQRAKRDVPPPAVKVA